MKKFFLIPLLTLLCTVMAWGNVAKITFSDNRTPVECADEAALRSALEALPTDGTVGTVTLLQDITITNASFVMDVVTGAVSGDPKVIKFPANTKSVLNLNGKGIDKTMSNSGFGNTDIDKLCIIYNQGELQIISEGNSILQMAVNKSGFMAANATTICNDGDLTIDGGLFLGPNGGYDLPKCPVIWHKTNAASTTINGGTFLCYEGVSDYNKGADFGPVTGPGTWHVRGGIFSTDEMEGTPLEDDTKHKNTGTYYLSGKIDASYKAIDVPYTNANITGYNSATRTNLCPDPDLMPTMYNDAAYKNKYRYAVKPVCVVVPKTASTDNFLYVDEGVTLTVADGETLHVGEGGIVMGDATSKIVVAAGGKLISEGEIVTSTPDNLELTMDEVNQKYSYVAFNTVGALTKHPDATVVLKTKAYQKGDGSYVFHRFGVPTYLNTIKRNITGNDKFSYDNVAAPTLIGRWNYEINDWTIMMPDDENETFKSFQCYDMTNQADAKGTDYTFKTELVGRGDATLELYDGRKWQYFANSYTAPIDVVKIVKDLKRIANNNEDNILDLSIWVHNIEGTGWNSVSYQSVVDFEELGIPLDATVIEPTQAFVLKQIGSANDLALDYENYVLNPLLAAANSNPAPKRRVSNTSDFTRAFITVEAADGTRDAVKLYEGSDFDANYNSGFDVEKLMNEGFNMYFSAAKGNMAHMALNNVANSAITLETKEATSYTMNFNYVTLEGYVLRDNLTGTETEIVSGNAYNFSAPANSKIEGRFEIVAAAHMPTAIEDVEVNANVKGIYTLTGQYLGENFHALPAGVYVINGKKVVK